jgi:hypothetical protein
MARTRTTKASSWAQLRRVGTAAAPARFLYYSVYLNAKQAKTKNPARALGQVEAGPRVAVGVRLGDVALLDLDVEKR